MNLIDRPDVALHDKVWERVEEEPVDGTSHTFYCVQDSDGRSVTILENGNLAQSVAARGGYHVIAKRTKITPTGKYYRFKNERVPRSARGDHMRRRT